VAAHILGGYYYMKLLLDTNLVVEIGRRNSFLHRIQEDFPGVDIYVLEASIDEMEYIGGNAAHAARGIVRKLVSQGVLKIIESEGYVDDLLVTYNENYVVCTIDKELLSRLKHKKCSLIQGRLQFCP